ncbi:MAG: ABC transporter ATP-binding protein [Alphaproteobacteria bacterium]|nr:ABC transporter ATP-binding protein [Alphaproteobacteria bacterium]
MPLSLYAYVFQVSRRGQIILSVLTLIVVAMQTAPLELQRRIVDEACKGPGFVPLFALGGAYLALLLLSGGAKYALNVYRGIVVEQVTCHLRHRIQQAAAVAETDEWGRPTTPRRGAIVSMMAAEAEFVGGSVGERISVPLLQVGSLVFVLGYLVWVEPLIAMFAVIIYLPSLGVIPFGQRAINRWSAAHARFVRRLGDLVVHDGSKDRFGRAINLAYRTRILSYRVQYFLTFFENLLDAVGPLVVLMVGGVLVIHGHVEVSTIVVFISGFQKVSSPWDRLVSFYRSVSNARVRYRLIVDSLPPGVWPVPDNN